MSSKKTSMPSLGMGDEDQAPVPIKKGLSREERAARAKAAQENLGEFESPDKPPKPPAPDPDVEHEVSPEPAKKVKSNKVVRDQFNARIDVRLIKAANRLMADLGHVNKQFLTEKLIRDECARTGIDYTSFSNDKDEDDWQG